MIASCFMFSTIFFLVMYLFSMYVAGTWLCQNFSNLQKRKVRLNLNKTFLMMKLCSYHNPYSGLRTQNCCKYFKMYNIRKIVLYFFNNFIESLFFPNSFQLVLKIPSYIFHLLKHYFWRVYECEMYNVL